MLPIKKAILVITSVFVISSGVIISNRINKDKGLKTVVSSIDLNELKGDFIIITNYQNAEYRIDEIQLSIELDSYLEKINDNLKYEFEIKEKDVYITYKLKGSKMTKKYTLLNNFM